MMHEPKIRVIGATEEFGMGGIAAQRENMLFSFSRDVLVGGDPTTRQQRVEVQGARWMHAFASMISSL
jgi:hypothetical protein